MAKLYYSPNGITSLFNNTAGINKFRKPKKHSVTRCMLTVLILFIYSVNINAQIRGISEVNATYQDGTESSYTVGAVTYTFGVDGINNDLVLENFQIDLGGGDGVETFNILRFADRVNIFRDTSIPDVEPNKQLLFLSH